MSRAYLAFTAKGEALARRLAEALPGSVSRCGGDVTLKGWTAEHFAQDEALIFCGSCGHRGAGHRAPLQEQGR